MNQTKIRSFDFPHNQLIDRCAVMAEHDFFASYSALAPENLITLAHLSVSSAMRLVYSPGDSASTSPPRSAMRVLIVGSARTALISRLSWSMISGGVFFGAPMPAHALVSNPGTKSPSSGMP